MGQRAIKRGRESFALSPPEHAEKATIWCKNYGEEKNGVIGFYVINGEWRGKFCPNRSLLKVDDKKGEWQAAIEVWRGEVPEEFSADYNKAISWIEDQITAKQ